MVREDLLVRTLAVGKAVIHVDGVGLFKGDTGNEAPMAAPVVHGVVPLAVLQRQGVVLWLYGQAAARAARAQAVKIAVAAEGVVLVREELEGHVIVVIKSLFALDAAEVLLVEHLPQGLDRHLSWVDRELTGGAGVPELSPVAAQAVRHPVLRALVNRFPLGELVQGPSAALTSQTVLVPMHAKSLHSTRRDGLVAPCTGLPEQPRVLLLAVRHQVMGEVHVHPLIVLWYRIPARGAHEAFGVPFLTKHVNDLLLHDQAALCALLSELLEVAVHRVRHAVLGNVLLFKLHPSCRAAEVFRVPVSAAGLDDVLDVKKDVVVAAHAPRHEAILVAVLAVGHLAPSVVLVLVREELAVWELLFANVANEAVAVPDLVEGLKALLDAANDRHDVQALGAGVEEFDVALLVVWRLVLYQDRVCDREFCPGVSALEVLGVPLEAKGEETVLRLFRRLQAVSAQRVTPEDLEVADTTIRLVVLQNEVRLAKILRRHLAVKVPLVPPLPAPCHDFVALKPHLRAEVDDFIVDIVLVVLVVAVVALHLRVIVGLPAYPQKHGLLHFLVVLDNFTCLGLVYRYGTNALLYDTVDLFLLLLYRVLVCLAFHYLLGLRSLQGGGDSFSPLFPKPHDRSLEQDELLGYFGFVLVVGYALHVGHRNFSA
mmetsp:Transcript_22364/g.46689  ORF Transcript_22364/g.46689 Transcript_22364/m.46689 type:complete len:655 (+) Transcript_22364:1096-3060(+)